MAETLTSGCVQQVDDFLTIHGLSDDAEARNFGCTNTGRSVATEGGKSSRCRLLGGAAVDGEGNRSVEDSKADNVIDQMEFATVSRRT